MHERGLLGEDPNSIPNNLLPYLGIVGDNYLIPESTGQRYYIHVIDLVDGHLKTLKALATESSI